MVKELVHRSREWLQSEEVAEYPGGTPKSPRLAHSARLLRAMRYILPKRAFLARRKAAPEPQPSIAPLSECIPSSSDRH